MSGPSEGDLDWDMVLDLTRELEDWQVFASPREARAHLRQYYDEDRWLGQRYFPVFVVEKDTLQPVCRPMAEGWQMKFASSRGYGSLTLQHDTAEKAGCLASRFVQRRDSWRRANRHRVDTAPARSIRLTLRSRMSLLAFGSTSWNGSTPFDPDHLSWSMGNGRYPLNNRLRDAAFRSVRRVRERGSPKLKGRT
jgi:hypothetical protein